MREMGDAAPAAQPESVAPERRFDPIDAGLGIITQPVVAMRSIAAARPWPVALGLTICLGLLNTLVAQTAPEPDMISGGPMTSPEFGAAFSLMRSPGWVLAAGLLVAPLLLVVETAIFFAIGHALGGRGTFGGLLSTLAFASVPSILETPFIAWINLAGGGLAFLSGLIGLGFGVWVLWLDAIAVRESLALSTGRAVATVLIPLAVLLVLVLVIAIVIVALFLSTLRTVGTL